MRYNFQTRKVYLHACFSFDELRVHGVHVLPHVDHVHPVTLFVEGGARGDVLGPGGAQLLGRPRARARPRPRLPPRPALPRVARLQAKWIRDGLRFVRLLCVLRQ